METQSKFITRFRPDGTISFANDAYCRYFGFDDCNIAGQKFMPSLPDDDRKRLHKGLRNLSPEHPELFIEHRIIMPDGGIRWHQWSDRAIFDSDGHIIEYQSVGRDITEKRQIEENLTESERRFRDLATLLPQVIFETDITGMITYVNQAAFQIFGYNRGDLENGINISQVIVPEEPEQLLRNFKNAIDGVNDDMISLKLNDNNPQMINASDYGGYDEEFLDFYRAIVNRKQVKSPFIDGYKDMEVVFAALKSAEKNKVIYLK